MLRIVHHVDPARCRCTANGNNSFADGAQIINESRALFHDFLGAVIKLDDRVGFQPGFNQATSTFDAAGDHFCTGKTGEQLYGIVFSQLREAILE